jgi:hypothetical protein
MPLCIPYDFLDYYAKRHQHFVMRCPGCKDVADVFPDVRSLAVCDVLINVQHVHCDFGYWHRLKKKTQRAAGPVGRRRSNTRAYLCRWRGFGQALSINVIYGYLWQLLHCH